MKQSCSEDRKARRNALHALLCFVLGLNASALHAQTETQLAGKPAPTYPHFRWVQNVNMDEALSMAIDGQQFPALRNVTADVYVVADRSAVEWQQNTTLTDVTNGGALSVAFGTDSIQQNTVLLAAPNEIVAYNALGIGVGYDIVIDVDGDGSLSPADFIDGADGPGFYALHDITQPGMLAVTTQDWIDSVPFIQRIYYPTTIATLDSLPLIVFSHGWTHNYTYYDYIGTHLASYGYVVISHWNDVGNGDPAGTQTASLSLIANVDHLLAHQDTLWGGILNGKIDAHRMGWMGHSTGGESVVRAFTRLHAGENSAANFTWQDVQFVSSICPVSWFPDTVVNPYAVNYHQFIGGADMDVSGSATNSYRQPMTIYERGTGNKHIIYVHGASHEVFHNDTTQLEHANGPDIVTRAQVHPLVKAYMLAMAEWHCKQNLAGKEFFTRSYAEYRPMHADDSVVITNEYRDAQTGYKRVIDDFESNDTLSLASSGATVTTDLQNSVEVLMKDVNGSFGYTPLQPSNGMTRARFTDAPHCLVMEWDSLGYLRYALPDSLKDFSGYEFLSFRACQRTHHPFNVALDGAIDFSVSLVDGTGDSAVVNIASYGPIAQTYQRQGGWQNEFCTVRIRLAEFLVNGTQLDLGDIAHLGFEFGHPGTSGQGALGIDDIELVNLAVNPPTGVDFPVASPASELLIYPNPNAGTFRVVFPNAVANGRLEVYSLLGQRIYSVDLTGESAKEIHLHGVAAGEYWLRMWDGERNFGQKLIVNSHSR